MLEWTGATFVKLTKIQIWQELVFVFGVISKIESREKVSKLYQPSQVSLLNSPPKSAADIVTAFASRSQ